MGEAWSVGSMHSHLRVFLLLILCPSFQDACPECCNLVYRTRVRDWPEHSRRIWGAQLEWYLDDEEVRTVIGRVDRYEIRHGKLKCWGGRIDEKDAQYETISSANTSITLHKLPVGYYGIQICSFNDQHARYEIDWNKAWMGSIDVGNTNGRQRHSMVTADLTQSTCQPASNAGHNGNLPNFYIYCFVFLTFVAT